jgi:hypothetical protein
MAFSDLMGRRDGADRLVDLVLGPQCAVVVLAVVEDRIDFGFGAGVNASMTARTASL